MRYNLRPRGPRRTDALLTAIYDALCADLLVTIVLLLHPRCATRLAQKKTAALQRLAACSASARKTEQ